MNKKEKSTGMIKTPITNVQEGREEITTEKTEFCSMNEILRSFSGLVHWISN